MKTLTFCLALIVMSCTLAFGQTYQVIYDFGRVVGDGGFPVSNLISDQAGNLYGTTKGGGNSSQSGCIADGGCGTVFELSPNSDGSWNESILYNFCTVYSGNQCLDGQWPVAGIVFDNAGNLYGTTTWGGALNVGNRNGTVFELSPPAKGGVWTETVLYTFCTGSNNACQDGGEPSSQLVFDTSGNLYGTTTGGGLGGQGTVFELSPGGSGWTHNTLYDFCVNGHNRICPDGDQPEAGVTFDRSGYIYGTTMSGGTKNSQGAGTVFRLSPGANGWSERVVVAFNPTGGNLQIPLGMVTLDAAGNLYSTASVGRNGGGVFEVNRSGKLRSFLFNDGDGAGPAAGLLLDSKAQAGFGTTSGGGNVGSGTVFEIVPTGQETVLYDFCQQTDCTDGMNPYASLIEDESGNLYGTTRAGGAYGLGVVFEITP